MLDLKFLEALVDEALSNETESTLEEWLISQRDANLFSYYGAGDIESINCSLCDSFEVGNENSNLEYSNNESNIINNSVDNRGLALAA